VVDICNKLAPFTERAEAVDSFLVIITVRLNKLYETKEYGKKTSTPRMV